MKLPVVLFHPVFLPNLSPSITKPRKLLSTQSTTQPSKHNNAFNRNNTLYTMPLAGGHSQPSKDIPPPVQKISDDIKPQLEEKLGRTSFPEYQLLEFRQQVVAGMIYHFKIQVSPSECVHAKVFQPLPHEQKGPEVQAAELKTLDDPLETLASD